MKIAIIGSFQNGFNLAKFGIKEGDEVTYFEHSPVSAISKQGINRHHFPRTEAEFFSAMVALGITDAIQICTTFRYGASFDLAAGLASNGINLLVGATPALQAVELSRWDARLAAIANGLTPLLTEMSGLKAAVKASATYPCFIKRKGSSHARPVLVKSATDTFWVRIPDDVELWVEPVLANASLLNVNYILKEGSVKLLNAYSHDFHPVKRRYGVNAAAVPLTDSFITDSVQPHLDAIALAHNTETAIMSVQFLVDAGVHYFLENNCHPSTVVPWRGLTDIATLVSSKAIFDADVSELEPFVMQATKVTDKHLLIDNLQTAIANEDIMVTGSFLKHGEVDPELWGVHHCSETDAAGVTFLLYNGAVVDPSITNLEAKV